MKTKILISFLILMLIVGCSADVTTDSNEIRFINGYVQNTDNNRILMRNGLNLRADQHVTAIGMTPIYVILEKQKPFGYAYLKGEKISVTLMKDEVRLSGTDDLIIRSTGKLKMIKEVSVNDRIIQLEDGTKWYVPNEKEAEMITDWGNDSDVIIPDENNRSKNSLKLINPYQNESIHVISAGDMASK